MEENKTFDHPNIDTREVMKTEMDKIWRSRFKRSRAKAVRMRKIKRIFTD